MGPAGFLLPDDATAAERMQIAFGRSGGWMDLSRGMERERVDERGDRIGHVSDEVTTRGFWRHWAELMATAPMSHELVGDDRDLRAEVEQLLFLEARLADESRYEEWLALMTDDVRYWVPSGPADYDPDTRISFVNDNRSRLETRVRQLLTGVRYAQTPPSPMRRVISNLEIDVDRRRRHDHRRVELRAVRAVGAGDERAAHLGRTGHPPDQADRRRVADRGEDGRARQRLAAAPDARVPAVTRPVTATVAHGPTAVGALRARRQRALPRQRPGERGRHARARPRGLRATGPQARGAGERDRMAALGGRRRRRARQGADGPRQRPRHGVGSRRRRGARRARPASPDGPQGRTDRRPRRPRRR